MGDAMNKIALDRAVLCVECNTLSDTPYETCPQCGSQHTLLSLGRVLQQDRQFGGIRYIYSGAEA